ncbi:MAG: GldG family protein [Leptospiraceae bacterium]|nr:GldG family protein [Leptospiraceae bacterium]MDW8306098.1 Gldg family protein [Leptospiraceae bacterium]
MQILNKVRQNIPLFSLFSLILLIVIRQFFHDVLYPPMVLIFAYSLALFYLALTLREREKKLNSLFFLAFVFTFLISYFLQNENLWLYQTREGSLREENTTILVFRTIMYASGYILVLYSLALLGSNPRQQPSHSQFLRNRVLALTVFLSFLIALNFAAKKRPIMWDATFMGQFQLSAEGKKYISEVREKLSITAFYPFFHELHREISIFLNDIAQTNNLIEVSLHDALREREIALEKKVDRNGWLVIEKKDAQATEVDKYSQVRKISVTTKDDFRHLEADLLSAIQALTSQRKNIYFTVNHGEILPDGNIREEKLSIFKEQLIKNNYEVKYLNAKVGFPEKVPDDAAAVIISGPRTAFSPAEQKALVNYFDRGGKFLIFLRRHGEDLSFLFRKLGLRMEHAPARSEVALKPKSNNLIAERYAEEGFTRRLIQMSEAEKFSFFPDCGSFTIEAKEGIFQKTFIFSDSRSFVDYNNNGKQDPPRESLQSLNIAVAAGSKTENQERRSVLAFASADFLLDKYIKMGQNLYLAIGGLNWLLEDERLIYALEPKLEEKPVSLSPRQDDFLFYSFVIIWPMLLLGGSFLILKILSPKITRET